MHDEGACPYGDLAMDEPRPDLSRPNHYAHDSLGCPHECSEDHNHPSIAYMGGKEAA